MCKSNSTIDRWYSMGRISNVVKAVIQSSAAFLQMTTRERGRDRCRVNGQVTTRLPYGHQEAPSLYQYQHKPYFWAEGTSSNPIDSSNWSAAAQGRLSIGLETFYCPRSCRQSTTTRNPTASTPSTAPTQPPDSLDQCQVGSVQSEQAMGPSVQS